LQAKTPAKRKKRGGGDAAQAKALNAGGRKLRNSEGPRGREYKTGVPAKLRDPWGKERKRHETRAAGTIRVISA